MEIVKKTDQVSLNDVLVTRMPAPHTSWDNLLIFCCHQGQPGPTGVTGEPGSGGEPVSQY